MPRTLQRLLGWASRLLVPLEQLLIARYANTHTLKYPPVFIIGAPRSGTTLLYQLLTHRYHFGYLSNFTASLYRTPAIGLWLEKHFLPANDASGEFQSTHGKTSGWRGPHEVGRFWYRWFPAGEHVYVPPQTTSSASLTQLRREVAAMTGVVSAPMLFKNTYNSMRIAPIVEALPEASFVVCWRNPVDTAQSLLKARVEATGTKDTWWSLPPRDMQDLTGRPYWEQVVGQVYYTYHQIDADRDEFGAGRFQDLSYEDLCRDTGRALAELEAFLASRGVSLETRGEIPARFPVSAGQQVGEEDYRRIADCVAELWP